MKGDENVSGHMTGDPPQTNTETNLTLINYSTDCLMSVAVVGVEGWCWEGEPVPRAIG